MTTRVLYAIYALAVLGIATTAQAKGWGLANPPTARVSPTSIRENPGAYRPIYRGSARTFRGK